MDNNFHKQELVLVSIIIPCYNEEKYIQRCLDSIIANDYPTEKMEILVVDGGSSDRTRDIIATNSQRYHFLRLLDNPEQIVPCALNIGLRAARGEIIIRMDSHATYPANYISGLVTWLEKSGADNVGGLWRTLPANDSSIAQAIALGLAHPFGVGNAYYRIGATEPRWVDTVPFGCWKRELFERLGNFDEELIRNQDDEFNHRLLRQGGRILLVPEIVIDYYARDSLAKIWRMYYQYGYFKPLVARKVGGILTIRQLIPAALVLFLIITGSFGIWSQVMRSIFVFLVVCYGAVDLYFSLKVSMDKGVKVGILTGLVFPVLHCSYGLGFLKGVVDFLFFRRKSDVSRISISR